MMHTGFPRTVADLKPGDHLCCLYETEAERRAVLTPFLRQGLEAHEKVVYIADTPTAESVLRYLRDDGLDVEPYMACEQLVILTRDEAYTRDGIFDPDRMIALLRSEMDRALSEGYCALRVTGEVSWALRGLPGSERLIEYEAKLNEFFPGSKCLAICQYDQRRFDPAVLLDVLRTHPIAIVGTTLYDNCYYIPPGELLGPDPPAAELRYSLRNLGERKRAEEALQESERKYRNLVDNALVGVFRSNVKGEILFVNDALVKLFQFDSAEELMAASAPMRYKNPEQRRQLLSELQEKGQIGSFEAEMLTKTGEPKHMLLSIRLDGETLSGTAIDITDRKRAQEALRRQRDELAARDHILRASLRIADLDERLGTILDEILTLLQVEYGAIHLVHRGNLVLRCWRLPSDEFRAHVLCILASDPPDWMRQVRTVHERLSEQGIIPDFAKRDGIQSWTSVPFWLPSRRDRGEGECLGSILVCSRRYEAVSEEHMQALESVADELALAIDHAGTYRRAQERLARLRALREVDRAVIQQLDLREVLHVVLERIPTELSGDAVAISLLDEGGFQPQVFVMRLKDGTFIEEHAFTLAANLLHWFIERQEPVIIYDLTRDPRVQMHRERIRTNRLITYLGVPLIARDKTTGILHILTTQPKIFSDEDVAFFRTMAGQAAIAIENSRLYEEARQELAERKRAQEALREYSERLEEMVEERTKELREAQEELVRREKLAALGQLAGGLAHELNGPLTGVLMYARRLLKKAEQEDLASHPALCVFPESLHMIEESAIRCRDIVRDLLSFARQEWREFGPLQVNEVVEAALRPMEAQLTESQVALKLDLMPDLPPIMGNANQLRQVLTTLMLNAQQAMPQGGELAISTRLGGSGRVQVEVRDTGFGIPEEIRSRIFEPFFTTRPSGEGTGLGLSTSYAIIEGHKGSIGVESTPGLGSIFTVTLPVAQEQADG